MRIPSYLSEYQEAYKENPREANLTWFKQAKYGLFLHYGLFSLLERHEWVQLKERIPVAEYEKLKKEFTAEKFDAEKIVAFAKDAGMKYITLTTRHHDGFCLWDTKETDFNSVNSPAKRDLVAELADQCEKQNMALFLYYSHGRDWRHPHAPNNDEWGGAARPPYDPPEPSYKYGSQHDLNVYLEFMKKQITELLTIAPMAAGIWLDGIMVPMTGDYKKFKLEELYAHIRAQSPHVLISYKQGMLGTEDFFAPEHQLPDGTEESEQFSEEEIYEKIRLLAPHMLEAYKQGKWKIEDYIKPRNQAPGAENTVSKRGKIAEGKVIEVCTTMIVEPESWGYYKNAVHRTEESVWEKLREAKENDCNLLLNTGLLGDGSLDPQDKKILLSVGKELKNTPFW